MQWYYAENGQQIGPVTESDIEQLVLQGRINDQTLVWCQSMKDWQAYGSVKRATSSQAVSAPVQGEGKASVTESNTARCRECQRVYPVGDMVQYQDTWICAGCKPSFFQRMHESAMGACPLCGRSGKMTKPKQLYGQMVCPKCYYAFANRRQLAYVLDFIGWRLILVFIMGMSAGLASTEVTSVSQQQLGIFLPLMLFVAFCCKDGFSGYSLGKLICGVRVIDEVSGVPIGFVASLKRNLLLGIPLFPLIVAVQLCKGHRWGDGWSRSKVIWKKYADSPVFAPTHTGE